MPRTADHEARRHHISAAAATVAHESGLSHVTIAAVARSSGVSVGLVQHYFPSKTALLQRVFADSLDDLNARVESIVSAGEQAGDPIRAMATQALGEVLPLDVRRVKDCLVRRDFRSLAREDPELTAIARHSDWQFQHRLAAIVSNGRDCGEADLGTDPGLAARHLWAEVTGIASLMLVDPDFPGLELLQESLHRAFPYPCRRLTLPKDS